MALPLTWIDRIFDRMAVRYGRRFMDQWAGVDLDAVKHDWASELDGLQNAPTSIVYGLANLPDDRPPTVTQFRAICIRGIPSSDKIALPAPRADLSKLQAEFDKLRRPLEDLGDMKAWARRLKARHDAGEKLNANQIRCYKNALGLHAGGVLL
jgi:hypothetical protein